LPPSRGFVGIGFAPCRPTPAGTEEALARLSSDRKTMVTLFLCGDVMTGRGVDQILPHPVSPELHEPYVRDAREYVALAESANGPVQKPVDPAYIWGDALDELTRVRPAARIINLETSITRSNRHWEGKGIHYRMNPANVACLTASGADVCALANNHVLDYGHSGLEETLDTLAATEIEAAGAGRNMEEANRPAVVRLDDGHRLLVFSVGSPDSGIPLSWAAGEDSPGVSLLEELSRAKADELVDRIRMERQPGDIVVLSIHWGDNWGYDVPPSHIAFAHRLVDGGVDLVHGHSSHHPRPIEVYRGKLVLYGCGDFIDDYEGISGYEEFRDDLVLMYFPELEPTTGELAALRMTPMRIRNIRLNRPSPSELLWLRDKMNYANEGFGSRVEAIEGGRLVLRW
jgi:poly-gamma-glutamate capsule biosynthesis protein CapA/YwtB (metallophosphatase superfamily)